ncbi:hypothetical protein J6590_069912 [Homalodisca vitripennis]|nr:hypothetical protein J6590_069912 [Homalodisca vitripennis]
MAGQAGCLQGQYRSAVTHPSSSHARRCLIRLSCNNLHQRLVSDPVTDLIHGIWSYVSLKRSKESRL